jgi:aconitate hydratase
MDTTYKNFFGVRSQIDTNQGLITIFRLDKLVTDGITKLSSLPYSIRVILEAVLRHCDGNIVSKDDVINLAKWEASNFKAHEIPFKPARVILQDFTGVPAVLDLAALRSAMHRMGGDPNRINPVIPVDLVIDHSVQADQYGSKFALFYNAEREFERNSERYEFLRWGQKAFDNFRVVPPSTGIVHQVNLEYFSQVVQAQTVNGEVLAYPDTLVGTDSHTTMVNGLGIVAWGVGGIEAEAMMLGQPIYMLTPQVVGFKLTGELPEGATATDLVLTATQMLREKGVIGKFVEYYGPGISKLPLADRATLANMAPDYGATMGFFPIDNVTLEYLKSTGRNPDLVERYAKEQQLFRSDDAPEPEYNDTLQLDLNTVEPSLAGPKRPQDRVPLYQMKRSFQTSLTETFKKDLPKNGKGELSDGSLVIAAITSCTNTSNPSVMVAAGLVAQKAVEKGLQVPAHVKTILAPGSRVVTRYLENLGLLPQLEKLGFHIVGYGCTSCIGNSGPLKEEINEKILEEDLVVASVLSGNRNFEGRVHPLTKVNYLASPPLVVAYALAGTVNLDLATEALGADQESNPIYLKDIWPTQKEIQQAVDRGLSPELFESEYSSIFDGNEMWNKIPVEEGDLYQWDSESTYIQEPPFFMDLTLDVPSLTPIVDARCLALLGDSVTTDHISPAGAIPVDWPAGQYLISKGIKRAEFNTFGTRRGNHEVMMRGTFGNIRLRNQLVPGSEGGITKYHPTGETMSIYDAAMKYMESKTPLIVIAGKEYGTGSSRDWAAKGTILLGVNAVIAESYERIHRSNLIGMGVLPLQFLPGQNAESLGLTGMETFNIEGIDDDLKPGQELSVKITSTNGDVSSFQILVRIDSPIEVEYYKNGGVLHTVLREMAKQP